MGGMSSLSVDHPAGTEDQRVRGNRNAPTSAAVTTVELRELLCGISTSNRSALARSNTSRNRFVSFFHHIDSWNRSPSILRGVSLDRRGNAFVDKEHAWAHPASKSKAPAREKQRAPPLPIAVHMI